MTHDSGEADLPKAKKSLGQHFLKNQEALGLIARALGNEPGDTVIEIGPGHGALTGPILASGPIHLIAIEKDEILAAELRAKYESRNPKSENEDSSSAFGLRASNFEIITGDALKLIPSIVLSLAGAPYRIVGNIPYYITGKLLRTIGDLDHKPLRTTLMVQKEVAERITSLPPHMNRLAAMIGAWALPRTLMKLPPTDFDPPPEVDSAILELTPRADALRGNELFAYEACARALFQQPRKTIANNLSLGYAISKEEVVRRVAPFGLTGGERPGNLSLALIRQMASEFSTHASP